MFDWLPRPSGDNGFGMCGDQEAGDGPGSIGFMYHFIDAMVDKNIPWLKLLMNVDHKSGRLALLEYARKKGRMVIVRPFRQPCHPTGYDLYDDFIRAVIDHGGNYIEVGNEPNLKLECTKLYPDYKYNGSTGHEAFVNLLYDQWLRLADRIRRHGGIPLFPAMSPTAYTNPRVYYHHRLYNDFLGLGKLRGNLEWAFEGTGVAIHNRPGDGQPLDKIDRCAFRDYEWIEATFAKALGRPIPLFGTEAGYEDGFVGDYIKHQLGNLYPNNEDYLHWHKILNHEIFKRFNPEHPKAWKDYLICQCMWLAADNGWYASGWARNARTGGGATYTWRDMNEIPKFTRAEGTDPGPPEPPEPPTPPEPPEPASDIEFVGLSEQMISSLVVHPAPEADQPYWKVTRVEVQPQTDNMSVFVDGGATRFFWGTSEHYEEPKSDPFAPPGYEFSAQMPMFSAWGGYGAMMAYENTESIFGFGLYGDNLELTHTAHHPVLIRFQWVEPTKPEPTEYTIFKAAAKYGLGIVEKRGSCGEFARSDEIAKRKPRYPNRIVVHYTASDYEGQTPESIAEWHTKPEEEDGKERPSIGYHFLIGFEAEVYFTAPVSWITRHCAAPVRDNSIGIAVMGKDSFTDAQVETLKRLISALQDWLGKGKPTRCYVMPHCDVWNGQKGHTECPGPLTDMVMEGEWPTIS